jgi:hypothetical protein
MHALTRPMSDMYCWQSRIASGSQAARCCGVHCCAAAGQDATVSARPSSTAVAAFIGQSFCCALRMSIIAVHLVSHLVSTVNSTTMGQRRQPSLVTGALDEGSALATQGCARGSLRLGHRARHRKKTADRDPMRDERSPLSAQRPMVSAKARQCIAARARRSCPLWVKSGPQAVLRPCLLCL